MGWTAARPARRCVQATGPTAQPSPHATQRSPGRAACGAQPRANRDLPRAAVGAVGGRADIGEGPRGTLVARLSAGDGRVRTRRTAGRRGVRGGVSGGVDGGRCRRRGGQVNARPAAACRLQPPPPSPATRRAALTRAGRRPRSLRPQQSNQQGIRCTLPRPLPKKCRGDSVCMPCRRRRRRAGTCLRRRTGVGGVSAVGVHRSAAVPCSALHGHQHGASPAGHFWQTPPGGGAYWPPGQTVQVDWSGEGVVPGPHSWHWLYPVTHKQRSAGAGDL